MSHPIVIDLILAAVLALFLWLGFRRGFILTLCSLAAVLVAMAGANLIADILSPRVSELLEPRLEQIIAEQLDEAVGHAEYSGVNGAAASTPEELPLSGVLEALRENKLCLGFIDSIEKILEGGVSTTVASAAARAAAAIAGQLARGIVFSAAFLLVLIAWFFVSHALNLVSRLPVISPLNHALGGILGAVKGLVILYIAVWVLYSLTGTVSRDTAEGTYLLSFLLSHSPLDLLKLV